MGIVVALNDMGYEIEGAELNADTISECSVIIARSVDRHTRPHSRYLLTYDRLRDLV